MIVSVLQTAAAPGAQSVSGTGLDFGAGAAGANGHFSASLPAVSNTAGSGLGSPRAGPSGTGDTSGGAEQLSAAIARSVGERIKQGDAFGAALKAIADPLTALIHDGLSTGKSTDEILGAVSKSFPGLDAKAVRQLIEQIKMPAGTGTPRFSIMPPAYRDAAVELIDGLFASDWAQTCAAETEGVFEAAAWRAREPGRDWNWAPLLATALCRLPQGARWFLARMERSTPSTACRSRTTRSSSPGSAPSRNGPC